MSGSKILALVVIMLGVLCNAVFARPVQADQRSENEAVQAASTWLAFIDNAKYSESWETSAVFFRNAVTKEQWLQALNATRKPLGRLVSRKLISKHSTTSLPGAPDGSYVVIQYQTSFENKNAALETITPMLDKDGKWRVSGYYIK